MEIIKIDTANSVPIRPLTRWQRVAAWFSRMADKLEKRDAEERREI